MGGILGVGQPASASASTGSAANWGSLTWGGTSWSSGAYAQIFTYDSLGRPSTFTLTEDGVAGAYTLSYDANGRPLTVAYPSGFTAKYTYTSLGYLSQISDNVAGTVFWTANARDAELHLLSQTQGNGVSTTQAFDPNTGLVQSILAGTGATVANQTYTFDSLGRLTARTWLNNAGAVVRENSCFDNLNRLTSTLVTSGGACTGAGAVTVAYDALGNITQKSDVCATANCYVYGAGAGPHAVTSIVGTYNGVVNPTFAYDANGAMTSGAGRSVTLTAFNMAAQITAGTNSAAFAYDSDHARYKMVTAGLNAGTTYYLNDPSSGAMEEKSIVAGVTTWRDYIMADGGMVAQRTCTGSAPCTSGVQLEYFILDHLGSVTVIVNATGTVLNRLSYDPWGKRRNADGSALDCTSGLTSPSSVTRGFTGQEMLDGLCLVNLNARVYDPALGRFMSADPIVGDVTVPQELNRYSYVLNDPLSLTDPSGLCGVFCIFKDVLDVLSIFFPVLQPLDRVVDLTAQFVAIAENPAQGLLGILVGDGLARLILTGNVKEFALNAFEAGLFYESGNILQSAGPDGILGTGHAASAFVLHGLVGGLTSELRSGNFASGFLAGGLSSLAPLRIGQRSLDSELVEREAAALGGIGAVLGGGKFEDGAQTGSFGYLFNDHAHSWGAAGAAGGAVAGGVAASAACDAATDGACAVATPETYAAGATAGAVGGYAVDSAAGTAVDGIIVTAQRVNANSSSSMLGTELYYLINRTTGVIDKIGITSYPGQRYSDAYLKAENVRYESQYYFQWRYAAYVAENIELMGYFATHGQFPRLNCCER